ncbi:hypothetical protein [Pseudomonas sp. LRF_L74]|uniref:hypothetical protein n=1 Tax=Pseudomonas sp. LRF_L74 TaxID=3369422 RepID=UPI003F636EC9
MSLGVLILGVALQVAFAGFQAMLVIFGGAAIANKHELSPLQNQLLMHCIWLLPAISLGVAGLLVYFYQTKSALLGNGWHLLPIACCAVVVGYLIRINR